MLKKTSIITLIALSPLLFGFDLGKELGNLIQQGIDNNLKPEVKFTGFTYIGTDKKGVDGQLLFKIKNRTGTDSKSIKYSYKIYVNGNSISGSSDSNFKLKANKEKSIKVPVKLTYNHMFSSPQELVEYLYSQEGKLKFTGNMKFKYDFGVSTAESDHKISGDFPLDFLDLKLQN